ncbi:MAG: pitrilysin family protein [Saprospiraceae bacterium]
MIQFNRYTLENGLRVLIHEDHSTPLVAVNLVYCVGSRDEDSERTGFAHLFEHLMFAGSRNIPDFDDPLQDAGGENNAYTTNDYTTFYEILPAQNLETALWLESDRMLALRINQRSFKVQRKVVVEEFKETCLNEPYGDSWHHLSEMMYKVHPYRWPVIGLIPEHIENSDLEQVKEFYKKWYCPNNAILSIAGNIESEAALDLVKKWFEKIPAGTPPDHHLPEEPKQLKAQVRIVKTDVPVTAIYLCFRMPSRLDPDFYAVDLLSDILGHGPSSRLYRNLLKEKQLFSSIDCYITANFDPGLLLIEGKTHEGIAYQDAIDAIWEELEQLKQDAIPVRELEKLKRRFESTLLYSELSILNKAQNLGYYEALGDASLINEESDAYLAVSAEDMQRMAIEIFQQDNSGTLVYVPSESTSI